MADGSPPDLVVNEWTHDGLRRRAQLSASPSSARRRERGERGDARRRAPRALGGPRYEVRSNRESGHGRYDVMALPKVAGQPGFVLELKTIGEGETQESALADALQQIREKDYATELLERGAQPIHELAAVFDGKRAWVRAAAGSG
jgi:hypothetical protein